MYNDGNDIIEIAAPAKINLYLEVLGKREDGYHEIETLFEKISLCDRLSVELTADKTAITCDDPRIPTGADSLMGRAIKLFNEKTRAARGIKDASNFRVTLKKNIPVSAGLGGGSSDAASLLKGLNKITGSFLGPKELLEIAGSLGADIPFFMGDAAFAYATGRGDIIRKIETDMAMRHILINPPFEVSTKEVYGSLTSPGPDHFGLTKKKRVDRIFTAFLRGKNQNGISINLRNDLQAIILRKFPALKEVVSELKKAGAENALLSGSGPTFFGLFDPGKAEQAARYLAGRFPEKEGWRVMAADTYFEEATLA